MNEYIKTKDRPTEGTFTAVWEYDGHICSGHFMWENGTLMYYIDFCECCDTEDHFEVYEGPFDGQENFEYIYLDNKNPD